MNLHCRYSLVKSEYDLRSFSVDRTVFNLLKLDGWDCMEPSVCEGPKHEHIHSTLFQEM